MEKGLIPQVPDPKYAAMYGVITLSREELAAGRQEAEYASEDPRSPTDAHVFGVAGPDRKMSAEASADEGEEVSDEDDEQGDDDDDVVITHVRVAHRPQSGSLDELRAQSSSSAGTPDYQVCIVATS